MPGPTLPSGWQRYFDALLERSVPEGARLWLVRHAHRFVAMLEGDGLGLRAGEPGDVAPFLNEVSREAPLRDWRFRQCVQAMDTADLVSLVDFLPKGVLGRLLVGSDSMGFLAAWQRPEHS